MGRPRVTVTSVRLRLLPNSPRRVRAVGCLVLDACFQVEHVHVVQRPDGSLLVAMPSRYEGFDYHDVAHPITAAFRAELNEAVMKEYISLTKQPGHVKVSP